MPRISKKTIDQVNDLDIVEIIGREIDLKAKGANKMACCPFHGEKTPSLSVSPAKQVFKCFGCGEAGGGIRFIEKLKNIGYKDAIEYICKEHNIKVEYDNLSAEDEKKLAKEEKERADIQAAIDWATGWFIANTEDKDQAKIYKDFLKRRDVPEELAVTFKLGFAPEGWDVLFKAATGLGFSVETLEKASLISKSAKAKNGYVDYFRNRVIFPIQDITGRVVAFTGRDAAVKSSKEVPKYLNSKDSCYNKSKELYGLFLGSTAIRKKESVYIVEGPLDVIQMFRRGVENVVAPCGTAFTETHAKQLKRLQGERVIVLTDPDNAGAKALHKTAEICFKEGFKVDVLLLTEDDGDPADAFSDAHSEEDVRTLLSKQADYLTGYLVNVYKEAEGNAADDADNAETLFKKLQLIPSESRKKAYHADLCNIWKKYKLVCAKKLADATSAAKDLADKLKAEEYRDLDELGFFIPKDATGKQRNEYHVREKLATKRISNFTVRMVFYINTGKESYYILEFKNVDNRSRVVKASTKDIATKAAFNALCNSMHGSFEFDGTDSNLSKLREYLRADVPLALEPSYLGWNDKMGAYIWSNGVFYGDQFLKADKYGIVKIGIPIKSIDEFLQLREGTQIRVEETTYVIPPPADFLDEFGEDYITSVIEQGGLERYLCIYIQHGASYSFSTTGGDSDAKDLLRMFKHFDKGEYNFINWAKLIVDVYGDNGKVAIMYYVACLFRDIIYKSNNNWFPILAPYGKPQSGKSTLARSIARMFGETLADGIHLGKGGSTVTGFKRAAASIVNGVLFLNEYKNTLEPDRIQALKSLADGSGKIMGEKTGGNETKNFEPQSGTIMAGQDLPTADPALLERVIPLKFDDKNRNYDAFKRLTEEVEDAHLTTSVTNSLLKYRPAFDNDYNETRLQVTKEIKALAAKRFNMAVDDRLTKNAATILTPYLVLKNAGLDLPFSYEELAEVMLDVLKQQIAFRNTADDVAQFLNILISILGKEIHEGEHFKIESVKNQEGELKQGFFLRLGAVTNLYREKAARIPGTSTLTDQTLGEYLKSHPWFIAYQPKNVYFDGLGTHTSAYILDYDQMVASGLVFAKARKTNSLPHTGILEPVKETDNAPGFNFSSTEDQANRPPIESPTDDLPF